MASGFRTKSGDGFLTLDAYGEVLTFTCPICHTEQTHKLTVKFFLELDNICCECGGVSLNTYFNNIEVTVWD